MLWGVFTIGWWIYLIVMLVAKLFEVETLFEGFMFVAVTMFLALIPSAFIPEDL